MTMLYETKGNELETVTYATVTGYTMARELRGNRVPWVLRAPSGDEVDFDPYRSKLARRNGFELDEYGC